ncbi:MAG: DUF5011 domain-containing protein, partial [Deltaproteobacteria bacterium]|nr:DUF5011 domain-containing protein [Deltaproteobacteria bacterium]
MGPVINVNNSLKNKLIIIIAFFFLTAWTATVARAGHFTAPVASPAFSDFMGYVLIDNIAAQPGDEVAFYDPDSVLCGLYVVQTAGQYGVMHVYGDDIISPGLDEGAVAGDPLSVRVWDADRGVELSGAELVLTPGFPAPNTSFSPSSVPPLWQDQQGFALNINTASHFGAAPSTPYECNYIGDLYIMGDPAETGDEVGVFDSNNILRGSYRVTTAGQYGIVHVYGDDPATSGIVEGAVEGEALTFKVWDRSQGREDILSTAPGAASGSFVPAGRPPVWSADAGYVLDLELSNTRTLTINLSGSGSGTVTSDVGNINCGSVCSDTYDNGKTVTLAEEPDSDSVFSGWSGDCDADGRVAMDADKTCTAEFILFSDSINSAVDTTGLNWTTGGDASFFDQSAVTHDGEDAVRSGSISDNQETWMETIINGPVTLSFYWKISADNNDFLALFIDGLEQASVSGETDWRQGVFPVSAGSHSVKWQYSKGVWGSAGSDAGWIDMVVFSNCGIEPAEVIYPSSGGEMSIDITELQSSCTWVATTDSPWLTITSGADGSGSGVVTYLVDANDDGVTRQGLLIVDGIEIPVSQFNADPAAVYVSNIDSDSVSVISPAANRVIATVPVEYEPRNLAANPNGTRVYVPNRHDDSVSVIDTATNTVVETINDISFDEPYALAVTPDGREVWVANKAGNSVTIFRTADNTVTGVIDDSCFYSPEGIAMNPLYPRAYVANRGNGTVCIVDTDTRTVLNQVDTGSESRYAVVGPDGLFVYESSGYKINTVDNTAVSVGIGGRNMAITAAGDKVYAADQWRSLTVLHTADDSIGSVSFSGASSTYGVAIAPGTHLGYVSDEDRDAVWVFDTATDTPISGPRIPIETESTPRGITATSTPMFSLSDPAIDFGTLTSGNTSTPRTLTIANNNTVTAAADLNIGSISTDSNEFTIQNDDCSNMTLSPSELCRLEIVFSSATAGIKKASLEVPSNQTSNPVVIPLAGNRDQVVLTVGKSGAGSGTVTSEEIPTPRIDCGSTCSAFYDDNATVTLTAAPDAASFFVGWSGDCTDIGNSQATVTMDADKTCTAGFQPNPDISVDPLEHDFGSVDIGSSSAIQSFMVSNNGGSELILGTIGISGNNADDFTIVDNTCDNRTLTPLPTPAQAMQWPAASGGNDHWYMAVLIPEGITWDNADIAAQNAAGYLATITSPEENAFVHGLVAGDVSFWYVDAFNNTLGPWLGGFQPDGSPEPDGGWQWVSNEPFTYTNWAANEPTNVNGIENRIEFFGNGVDNYAATWNDLSNTGRANGFVIEFDSQPQPGFCTVDIQFSPTELGTGNGVLEIPSSDPATPVLFAALTGNAIDSEPPVITILGNNPVSMAAGSTYNDAGATATDNVDAAVSVVVTANTVNTSAVGSYVVTYSATDTAGNIATATRTVNVTDQTAPVITILGDNPVTMAVGGSYTDAGATATDNVDATVTVVVTANTVNTSAVGSYIVTYSATDTAGNIA